MQLRDIALLLRRDVVFNCCANAGQSIPVEKYRFSHPRILLKKKDKEEKY